MAQIGIRSYRFSVSWPRIYPDGTGAVNRKGIDYYKRLVECLLAHNIEPMLTLYHWDLPQALQDKGGWTNRDIVHYFTEYAATMYRELGGLVKWWATHNEPWVPAFKGYAEGEHAPGKRNYNAFLKASHHLLLSHGEAVKAFRQQLPDGKIGIILNLTPAYSFLAHEEYTQATALFDGWYNRWYLDALFKGSYPSDIIGLYRQSPFLNMDFIEAGDLASISEPLDFLGVNYYTSMLVEPEPATPFNIFGFRPVTDTGRPKMDNGWDIHAPGLYDLLKRIDRDYTKIPLFITENGATFADVVSENGDIIDTERIDYLREHIEACYRAIQDGVNLQGYFVWSLMDNFEWVFGYSHRFGLVYVDFSTQERILKASAQWFKQVIAQNGLPELNSPIHI
jgi:beta-glucosidase